MIAIIYSLLAAACIWLARSEIYRLRAGRETRVLYPIIWAVLTLVLGLLAIQEVTGLLNLVTDGARRDALTEGWYAERRPFQWLLIKTVPVIALSLGAAALWVVRNAWQRYLLAVTSILYWASYAVIQGISFHNIDWLLRQHTSGLQNKTWGDLVGMVLTAAALLIAWEMDRRQGPAFVSGRGNRFMPHAPAQMGRISRLAWAAKRSLRAEGQIFADWYLRYRFHRRRGTPRHKAPDRRR